MADVTTLRASIPFKAAMDRAALDAARGSLRVVQVNVGKVCNQACHHCHVDAGPKRTERISEAVVDRIIYLLRLSPSVASLDITGGAPELSEHFTRLVRAGRELGLEVIDRCNLTILVEPDQEWLLPFLVENSVRVIASLPCYSEENVDRQRGRGVFEKSIRALRALNAAGYGIPGSNLVLDLVYNPGGASLPGSQVQLESAYKKQLAEGFGIVFSSLFTITNMPIKRFLSQLKREGKQEEYMQLLVEKFNPHAARAIMCRELVSVSWDGFLYDCDFNQMLEIPAGGRRRSVWEIDSFAELEGSRIAFADHCYGCTAGAGSSCGGSLTVAPV